MKIIILLTVLIPAFCFGQDAICPIKIIKYKLSKNIIQSNEITIIYKNESNKNIDAITFSVACYNNFNEPVNGSYVTGNIFSGICQSKLKAGEREKNTWTMYLFDNTTKVSTPIITKVHFIDGATWELPIDSLIKK
jgi:hypothetical protein